VRAALIVALLLAGFALAMMRTGPVPSVCIAGTWHLAGPDCPPAG
jgi:hypothetical protein